MPDFEFRTVALATWQERTEGTDSQDSRRFGRKARGWDGQFAESWVYQVKNYTVTHLGTTPIIPALLLASLSQDQRQLNFTNTG